MSKKAKRTETAPQKANSSLIALCAVLVVAVVLIVVMLASNSPIVMNIINRVRPAKKEKNESEAKEGGAA